MNKKNKKGAFTLAELLVAMSILAVIAVMTVPSLRDDAQRKENAAKVTKAYASIAQAFDYMEAQLPMTLWKADWAYEQLEKQLNIIGEDCFPAVALRFPNGDGDSNYGSANSYRLADGTCARIIITDDLGELSSRWGLGSGKYKATVSIDVNGANRPNVWGQDVFLFKLIPERGLVPSGAETGCGDKTGNDDYLNSGTDLYGCAAKVIQYGKTTE